MMGDQTKELNGLYWYKIPPDPRQPWEKHKIGPGIHGGISPAGVGDIAGNGHLDVVRGDTWFENKDGKGLEWIAHKNIPMGRRGRLECACAPLSPTWMATVKKSS